MKEVLTSIGVTLAVTVALLAAIELAVVASGSAPPPAAPLVIWAPNVDSQLTGDGGNFRLAPKWLWEPRPGSVDETSVINVDAYRGPAYPRTRGAAFRIATMGDSSTYGMRFPEAASWPRVLEQQLRAQGLDVEVLNFGVIGFTAVQGLALYRGKVRDFQPDVVVVAFGAVNDQLPPPSGLSDQEKIELLDAPGARAVGLLRKSAGFRWFSSRFVDAPLATGNRSRRVSIAEFERALLEVARLQDADGHATVFVCPPRRAISERVHYPHALAYTDAIHRMAPRAGVPLAEVRTRFRQSQRKPDQLFVDRNHPTEQGHRLWTAVVARTMADAGLLK